MSVVYTKNTNPKRMLIMYERQLWGRPLASVPTISMKALLPWQMPSFMADLLNFDSCGNTVLYSRYFTGYFDSSCPCPSA